MEGVEGCHRDWEVKDQVPLSAEASLRLLWCLERMGPLLATEKSRIRLRRRWLEKQ